jgi:hypothetical protein
LTTYRIPRRLAHVVPDGEPDPADTVFLMPLPDGVPVVLRDTAAWIWLLAAHGEGDVAGAIEDLVGVDRGDIADDVTDYLVELVETGLLDVDTASV